MSRVYIAGPMRGYPEHNIPQFRVVAKLFRSIGHEVVSPVEVGEAWAGPDQNAHPPEAWVRADLVELLTCNAIALLPGWEASTGARCEAAVAVTLGFQFYDAFGLTTEPPARIVIAGGYNRPPAVPDTLDSLFEEVRLWQRATFPHASRHSVATHLLEEAEELFDNPTDDAEVADVAMLLAGTMPPDQLIAAIRSKLDQNKQRIWGSPDADGVVRHVKTEGAQ